jgi:hypothetical protein
MFPAMTKGGSCGNDYGKERNHDYDRPDSLLFDYPIICHRNDPP